MEQVINSAALYCQESAEGHVPIEWLEGALNLFDSYNVRVREYGVAENPVCPAGVYSFPATERQLRAAVQTGTLRYLELYHHTHQQRESVTDWEGLAIVNFSQGYAYLGLPTGCGARLDDLIRRTHSLVRNLSSWGYGIGYSRPGTKAPSLYAVGVLGGSSFPYPDETDEDLDRVACWDHELHGARRHLKDRLRDVYPANLLSTAHVNARVGKNKTLLTAGWGNFTQLDVAMWLWTVPDDDIATVRAELRLAGLLLCP
jgi:hypothetical protein